jgi:chromosome partitioning protein
MTLDWNLRLLVSQMGTAETTVDFPESRKIYNSMSKAQVISLIQMKGGVGKTTCAVNLAACLAKEHNQKVLLVDLDPQTNASLSLMSEDHWKEWAHDHGTMADILEIEKDRKSSEKLKLADCIIRNVVPDISGLD